MTEIKRGPLQTRTCTCRKPRCFADDEGRCHRCGYVRVQRKRASMRGLVDAIARIIIRDR